MESYSMVKVLSNDSVCERNSSSPADGYAEFAPDLALVCLSTFNAMANGLCVAIFRNKAFDKSIMSVLLFGLSLFEVAFQLSQSVYHGVSLLRDCCDPKLNSRLAAVCISLLAALARQVSSACQLARNWTLAMLSLYRYEAVCRPMAAFKVFRKENSARMVLAVAVLCSLITLPRLFEANEIVCQSQQVYSLRPTGAYLPVMSNQIYQLFYLSACLFLLQSGGPTITVLICSAFVLRVLWARQRFRQNRNMRQRQSGTDKLIIMLALTFFVMEMPAFFAKLLFSFEALQPSTDYLLSKTANLLITLDSSMNLFIYLFSNPTFVSVAKQLLCRSATTTTTAAAAAAEMPEAKVPETGRLLTHNRQQVTEV